MIEIINFYDDCRDGCQYFRKSGYCSIACSPFNKEPIHWKAMKRVLNSNLKVTTNSDTLREAKEKIKNLNR